MQDYADCISAPNSPGFRECRKQTCLCMREAGIEGGCSQEEIDENCLDISEDNMGRVFFTNGGAESNENAIKMARMVTGRTKIFSRYRSYHGATLGAGNASGDWRRFAVEAGGANGFVKPTAAGCVGNIRKLINE